MKDKKQRGFTLVELLAAMAIGGLLIPVIVTAIYQTVRGTAYNSNKIVAMADIESAANWVARDVSQALSTDLVSGALPVNRFRVDWIDETGWAVPGQEQHSVEYTLQGTSLQRNYNYGGTLTIVARYVSNVGFSRSGTLISMSITSDVPGGSPRTETLSYNFRPRIDAGLQ